MPKFTAISPTRIEGEKPAAWRRFRDGGYIAIGPLNEVDLTGKSIDEIVALIRHKSYEDDVSIIQRFERFVSLEPGDYVAVNNVNYGLFGVGVIESGYRFQLGKHDRGGPDHPRRFYPHYMDVRWLKTEYVRK